MTLQYTITGGQLYLEKKAFARELLISDSPFKKLVYGKGSRDLSTPKVDKLEAQVRIDFNQSEVETDEGFYELFRKLKGIYREKMKGKIVIRITALTSYYVTLNMNSEDDRVIYE